MVPRSTTTNDRTVFLFWRICEESEEVKYGCENTTKSFQDIFAKPAIYRDNAV